MSLVIVPAAVAARRRIARHFLLEGATGADQAIFFEPGLPIRRRMFEHLRRDGSIKVAPGGMYYLDLARYREGSIRRRLLLAAVTGALAAAGAAVTLLG